MAKESLIHLDRRVIFHEGFQSMPDIVNNGGDITNVDLDGGVATFNGSSYIQNKRKLNGTYSVRIRIIDNSIDSGRYYLDFRGSGGSGTGYIHITTGNSLDISSGTGYINGTTGSTIDSNTVEVVITGISIATNDLFDIGQRFNGAEKFNGTIDLIDIYECTLTAEEVQLLYENSLYDGLVEDELVYHWDFVNNQSFHERKSNIIGTNSGWEIVKQGLYGVNGSDTYDFGSDIDMGTEQSVFVAVNHQTDFADSFEGILGVSNGNLCFYYLKSGDNIAIRFRDSIGGSTENALGFGNAQVGKAAFGFTRKDAAITQFFGTIKTTDTLTNPTYKFFFDKIGRTSDGGFKGYIKAIAIYNKQLTDKQAMQNIQYFKQLYSI